MLTTTRNSTGNTKMGILQIIEIFNNAQLFKMGQHYSFCGFLFYFSIQQWYQAYKRQGKVKI